LRAAVFFALKTYRIWYPYEVQLLLIVDH